MTSPHSAEAITRECRRVLEDAWIEERSYCRPNTDVYPHQWLWDSCFHSIAWGSIGDDRALRELGSIFLTQLGDGCVPHIRYDGESDTRRGPLATSSSYTQPPIYAHTANVLRTMGYEVSQEVMGKIAGGLDYLWRRRRTPEGLIFILHPWESGADDSPRWDDWLGGPYSRILCTMVDIDMVSETYFNSFGSAVASERFKCAPAAFSALTAHAFFEFAEMTGEALWSQRGASLAQAVDDLLWNEAEGLWDDMPLLGGGPTARIPTLDGVLPALVTSNESYAKRALAQLTDPNRFEAPLGLAYTARDHPTFDPSAYWRGPAWPQMNYLVWLAARRRDPALADSIVAQSVEAAFTSTFAEYWNPLTGEGLGAIPQTWATIIAAYGALSS